MPSAQSTRFLVATRLAKANRGAEDGKEGKDARRPEHSTRDGAGRGWPGWEADSRSGRCAAARASGRRRGEVRLRTRSPRWRRDGWMEGQILKARRGAGGEAGTPSNWLPGLDGDVYLPSSSPSLPPPPPRPPPPPPPLFSSSPPTFILLLCLPTSSSYLYAICTRIMATPTCQHARPKYHQHHAQPRRRPVLSISSSPTRNIPARVMHGSWFHDGTPVADTATPCRPETC